MRVSVPRNRIRLLRTMALAFPLAVVYVGFLHAPLSGQSPLAPGCFDVELGPWMPELDIGGDSIEVAPPPRIYLDTLSGRGLGNRVQGNLLEPAPGAMPSHHRYSWWFAEGDSIHLVWTTGFAGLRIKLRTGSQPLTGTAETFWDFDRDRQRAPAIVRRVACDSALPAAARFQYRYPRGVAMVAGDSIRVGDPLPQSGLEVTQESDQAFRVLSAAAEPYADAAELLLVVNEDNRVRQIRIRFPAGITHESIVRRLVPFYGVPTSSARTELRSGGVSHLTLWSGRLISIGVSGTQENGVGVMIRDARR